jgi:D-inositol-3-phosphate glycosyltransferase
MPKRLDQAQTGGNRSRAVNGESAPNGGSPSRPAEGGSPNTQARQTTADELQALQTDVKETVESALETRGVISQSPHQRTGGGYQTVRLGDSQRGGFRSTRPNLLPGFELQGRSVCDLGANLGEIARDLRRAGAAQVDAYEYDEFFTQLARYITAYNGLSNVNHYQADVAVNGFLRGEYDVGLGLSAYSFIRENLDYICGQIGETLIIETHEVTDSSWPHDYVEPISRHFPYWCCFGTVAHGRSGSAKRRLWLAFFRWQRTGFAFYGRRAIEILRDAEGVVEVDLTRSTLNLLNETELLDRTDLIFQQRSNPLSEQSLRLFAERLDEYERRLETGEYVNLSLSGEPYWLALLLGLGQLDHGGTLDEANAYWKWMIRGVEAGVVDQGLKPLLQDQPRLREKMSLRLSALGRAVRDRDTSHFPDVPIAYNATPHHQAFEGLHLKALAVRGSDEVLCVPRLNGHHRLFVMRLLEVETCPMMTIWDPQFLSDPPALARVKNYETRIYQYLAGAEVEDPMVVDGEAAVAKERDPILAEDLDRRESGGVPKDPNGRASEAVPMKHRGGQANAKPPEPGAGIRLVRAVDPKSWRHSYAIEDPGSGVIGDALGELRTSLPPGQGVPVWVTPDARAVTRDYGAASGRPPVRQVLRWIGAPLVWGRPPWLPRRIGLVVRRFWRSFRRPWRRVASEPDRADPPVGYLYRERRPGTLPLYTALQPVVGDQLLTTSEAEIEELGYLQRRRLGFIVSPASLAEALETSQHAIPWAGRGGVRRGGEQRHAKPDSDGADTGGRALAVASGQPGRAEHGRAGQDGEPGRGQARKAAKGNGGRQGADRPVPGAVIGLVRAVDPDSWRHTYGLGDEPSGELDGPLGTLRAGPPPGHGIGVWVASDGRVVTRANPAVCDRPPLRRVLRWVFGALVWGRPPSLPRRIALVARRFMRVIRRPWRRLRAEPEVSGRPRGYLHGEPAPGRKILYSALHPVAGDQLLTTSPEEIEELGYLMPKRLGFIVSAPSVARTLGTSRHPIRWASRQGLRRSDEKPSLSRGRLAKPDPSEPAPVDAVHVAGWAVLGDEAVARAEILLNGESVGLARLGVQRSGKAPPDAPEWPIAGFDRRLSPSMLPPSGSQVLVEVLVTGVHGTELMLSAPAPLRLKEPVAPLELPDGNGRGPARRSSATRKRRRASREGGLEVLAFTHRLSVGGAQRYMAEQLVRLAQADDTRCTVVAATDGPWREPLTESGIEVIVGSEFPLSDQETYEARIDEISEWANDRSFDVVYANTLDAFLGVDVADRLDLPSLWAIHESFDVATWWAMHQREAPEPYVRSRSVHALRSANALLFAADATKPFYRDYVDERRMLTAPYALELPKIDHFVERRERGNLRRRLGLDDETTLVMCLAVIEPRKGQAVLAKAWAQVCDQHPNAHLALVGEIDSPYCHGLRDYLESTGLSERCTILPATMDPYQWHHAADIYVLASEVESSPIAVLEAMAFETLAVSSDVFGVPELIMHGKEGFLFRPNDVSELAYALDRVLRLPSDERARVAKAGSRRVRERHDPDHYHRMLSGALRQIAAHPDAVPRWETRP